MALGLACVGGVVAGTVDPVGRHGFGVRAEEDRVRRLADARAIAGGWRRSYRWANWGAGNTGSVRHGANSERIVTERVIDIAEYLFANCPWLVEVDGAAIERYCRAEARARLLSDEIERVAAEVGIGKVRPHLLTEVGRAEANAQKFGQDLGLDPTGRAKVLKDLGWAKQLHQGRLEELQSRGRSLRRPATPEVEGANQDG